MHDVVKIIYSETAIVPGFSGDSSYEIIPFASRFISTLPGK